MFPGFMPDRWNPYREIDFGVIRKNMSAHGFELFANL